MKELKDFIIENGTFDKVMKVIKLPLTSFVIDFVCEKCGFKYSFRLFPDKDIGDSFGICRRCKEKMVAKEISFDWQSFKKGIGIELSRKEIDEEIKTK